MPSLGLPGASPINLSCIRFAVWPFDSIAESRSLAQGHEPFDELTVPVSPKATRVEGASRRPLGRASIIGL